MKHCVLPFLVGAPLLAAARDEHPVEKVIGLLQGLIEQVKTEYEAEETLFAEFSTWCKTSINTLDKSIAEGKDNIASLEAEVASKTKAEEVLTTDIKLLDEEIIKYEAAGAEADKVREDAAKLYEQADADFESTVTAIGDALTALEGAKASTDAALIQEKLGRLVQLPLVLGQLSDAQVQALAGSEEPKEKYEDVFKGGVPEKKYSFKSGSVVDLLKELKTKFEDDRVAATKAETNALNEYALAKDARDSAVEAAKTTKGEKETLLGETQAALATAKSDLESAQSDLAADTETLSGTTQQCNMKKSEWAERSAIRENEQKALNKAIEILAKATGVRTEAPENPVLPPTPVEAGADAGFIQGSKGKGLLPSSVTDAPSQQKDLRQRAIALLRHQAQSSHSKKFAQFADEIAAHLSGPFDDINNMIQKMIFRLMAEQKDEDEHKHWCDLETSSTNSSIEDKEGKIATLELKIEAHKAKAAALAEEVEAARDFAAKLETHIAEATEIRNEGKTENKKAIDDAKKAQDALAKATAVLEGFYKDSGMVKKEAWEFVQRQPVELPAEPSTWDASYTGVSDPANQPDGILTVLKTISADFAQMEADTMAQEEMDQKAYDDEMKTSKIEKARRAKEAEMKDAEKKRTLDKVAADESRLKSTNNELGAAEQYMKDLGPACLEGDSTYEARKADRDAEIAALKEAQVILADAFKEDEGAAAPAFLAPVRKVSLRS
eukprot:TRINITY_DN111236_c0_g1_i1.p1 TRINITY_DN111236_c0_g1~~TRINITY_DN111236_c0_g1_i1.p1  ORF type:complete len:725 (+),score=296.09 TRINITY_DN111236_c0_g1_i1:89-2263(+)